GSSLIQNFSPSGSPSIAAGNAAQSIAVTTGPPRPPLPPPSPPQAPTRNTNIAPIELETKRTTLDVIGLSSSAAWRGCGGVVPEGERFDHRAPTFSAPHAIGPGERTALPSGMSRPPASSGGSVVS